MQLYDDLYFDSIYENDVLNEANYFLSVRLRDDSHASRTRFVHPLRRVPSAPRTQVMASRADDQPTFFRI